MVEIYAQWLRHNNLLVTSAWGFCDQESEHEREPMLSEALPRCAEVCRGFPRFSELCQGCSKGVPRLSKGVGGYFVKLRVGH